LLSDFGVLSVYIKLISCTWLDVQINSKVNGLSIKHKNICNPKHN